MTDNQRHAKLVKARDLLRKTKAGYPGPGKGTYWKPAMQLLAELERGEIVCLFPEGKLTADGTIGEFRPGILRILRESGKPQRLLAPQGTYQQMLGMGASFEHTTCSNLFRLPAAARTKAIERLVSPASGIGMNLMRVCIGTSDFCGEPWYSYSDLPPGETDPELRTFSIARDRDYILPVLREARRLNRDLLGLWHVRNALCVHAHLRAEHAHVAAPRVHQPGDALEECRLATTIRSEDCGK